VIFPVIAVIAVVGIVAMIIIIIVVRKKVNSSTQHTPTVYDTIDDPLLCKNELKNSTYSNLYKISHDKHTITSTDKVLYEQENSSSHTANDIEMQQNPAYGTSDKVIMDDNPAYGIPK